MYNQDNFPPEMKKKITLFKQFNKYFAKKVEIKAPEV